MHQEQAHIAAFDFDGTIISSQSGPLLLIYLLRKGLVSLKNLWHIMLWGLRYVLHLARDQKQVRSYFYENLTHLSADQIEQMMHEVHTKSIIHRYRTEALMAIAERKRQGDVCVLVSATFYDLAKTAATYLGMDAVIATKMEDDPETGEPPQVVGDVIQGEAKLKALTSWADETYGKGKWMLDYAYGDHYTDAPLLSAALHPICVDPSPTLKKTAKQRGWTVVDWS